MIKSESRKSNLFSALKSRRSLKDLSARVQKGTSLISGPFAQTTSAPTAPEVNNARGSKKPTSSSGPLSPLDVNTSQNKRFSRMYFAGGDGQENQQKRHSLAWKKRSSSPASEITLATLSAIPSDINSLESGSDQFTSPTIAEKSENLDSLEKSQSSHRGRSQYNLSDMEEPSTPTRIHRTTNIGDIRRFMESDDILPINNRKSLALEAHEIEKRRSQICAREDSENCVIKLVENAFVMTFFPNLNAEPRYWDEIDVDDLLKGDSEICESAFISL